MGGNRKADDVKETDKSFDSSMFAAAEEVMCVYRTRSRQQ